jgi:hypothetical protein
MGKRTFIYKENEAQALEDAFTQMASDLHTSMGDMHSQMESELSGWSTDTESRQAQQKKDQAFNERAEKLADVLDKAATAIGKLRDLAHKAEVDNVAVLD